MEHRIENGGLSVIIDERGAQLRSVRLKGCEYLWQGDPAYWEDQSPLLFPYVGRFTEGKYTYNEVEYYLPIHGFAKESDFQVTEKGPARIVLELCSSPSTLEVYPCCFRLLVTYEIPEEPSGTDTLSVTYQVENLSDEMMCFGIGGHPGFNVPLEDGLSFEDYLLTFSRPHTPTRVGHTEACFLSGIDAPFPLEHETDLPLHHDMFDEDAIVLKDMADTVTLHSTKGSRSVTMRYPHLPYLGLWHAPGTDAPYLCIEPWSSLPSRQDIIEEFFCKSDLIRLEPGGIYHSGWQMMLND